MSPYGGEADVIGRFGLNKTCLSDIVLLLSVLTVSCSGIIIGKNALFSQIIWVDYEL
jgi:hypothetical protein